MKPDQLLTIAINTLNRWNEDVIESGDGPDLAAVAQAKIIQIALNDVKAADGDKSKFRIGTREAIALAYAVLDIDANA